MKKILIASLALSLASPQIFAIISFDDAVEVKPAEEVKPIVPNTKELTKPEPTAVKTTEVKRAILKQAIDFHGNTYSYDTTISASPWGPGSVLSKHKDTLTELKGLKKSATMYYIAWKRLENMNAKKEKNKIRFDEKLKKNEEELKKLDAIEKEKGSLTVWQKGRRTYYQRWFDKRLKQIKEIIDWQIKFKTLSPELKKKLDEANNKFELYSKKLEKIHPAIDRAVKKIMNMKRLSPLFKRDRELLQQAKKLSTITVGTEKKEIVETDEPTEKEQTPPVEKLGI